MISINVLKDNFHIKHNCQNNIEIASEELTNILTFLKESTELKFNSLLTIIAIDYTEYKKLTYVLYSILLNEYINISIRIKNNAPTVTNIYRSAFFDECEIYDLFGINFVGNTKLKRLFMPKSWIGHPLLKNYQLKDERLSWNE